MKRRTFLRLSGAAAAGTALGCSRSAPNPSPSPRGAELQVLLVYFSRAGENYFNGGRTELEVGNTQVVAGMIRDALDCDEFRIEALDPYSDRYDPTVERNVREQEEDARPGIIALPESIDAYGALLIGSPIWNVRVPRIMLTFAERFDFTGKTVYPFTTHAMSGLGHAVEEYTAACKGATIGEALAIRGEEVAQSRAAVETWLLRTELVRGGINVF